MRGTRYADVEDFDVPDPPVAAKRRPTTPRWRTAETTVAAIAGLAAIGAALIAAAGGGPTIGRYHPPDSTAVDAMSRRELRNLGRDIQTIQARLQLLARPSNQGRLSSELRALQGRVQGVEKTSNDLRRAILPDATEAVQVPLLRKDVEQLQSSSQDSLKGVERDIDRQFAFITFIAGSLGIGLLSQVLASRRRSGEAEAPSRSVAGSR